MLDTSQDLTVCAEELGMEVEQLITPLTGYTRQRQDGYFCVDNGSFKRFLEKRFRALLDREAHAKHLCRFVAVPDVVGDAQRTAEVFDHWKYQLIGWPLALVAQNGLERMAIPWKQIDAIFIGGTDLGDGNGDWKLSHHAESVIKAAKAIGKWVHVGRVNTPERADKFIDMEVDSIDGTGLNRYTHMRQKLLSATLFEGAGHGK